MVRRGVLGVVDVLRFAAAVAVGYLCLLTAGAWWSRLRGRAVTSVDGAPTTRFRVVVPAHDEEALIATTVRSLVEQDYPADLYSVHVVADNCTDRTAELAQRAGASVHVRTAPDDPGKGAALTWLIRRLDAEGLFDAVFVVDADTVAGARALRVMDARLRAGAAAVQAHYSVRDAHESTAPIALRAAALSARHYARPLGRRAIGGCCGLFGNGMAIRREIALAHGMSKHLTEDLELQLKLVGDGLLVDFAPDAEVWAEMPDTYRAATSQNERWERGRQQLAVAWAPRLARQVVRPAGAKRMPAADALCDVLVPPLSVLASTLALTSLGSFLSVGGGRRRRLASSGLAAGALGLHFVGAMAVAGAPRSAYRALASAPRLIVWKSLLWLRVLVRGARGSSVTWSRTRRNEAGKSPIDGAVAR